VSDELDLKRLERWLESHVEGFRGPFTLDKFANGHSNPTYRMVADNSVYVLRRQPLGTLLPSAHAIDREYRVLRALLPFGFPVPRVFALCNDRTVIGSLFYVMEMAQGQTLRDGGLPGMKPSERRAVYEAMTDTLAKLHNIQPAAAGLADYGRPGNYFERQTARWIRQYRATQTERIEAMEHLIEMLPATCPPQTGVAIVHGDFRLDNLIFADRSLVAALLDWELSTLGDPLADFSYYALNWVAPVNGRSEVFALDLEALGIPSLQETIARYCRGTGRTSLPALDWYFAYNLFRIASIMQGIKRRSIEGNASSPDAAEMAARVPLIAEAGSAFADRAGRSATRLASEDTPR